MQPLLDWLISELQNPAKAAGGMLGSTVVFIAMAVFRVVRSEKKRRGEEEAKVGPTVCHVVEPKFSQGTVIATARQIWDLEQRVLELRERLSKVDEEKKAAEADLTRTAASLNASDVALAESTDREKALAIELADLRRTIDSGFTRVRLPESRVNLRPIDVAEIDDRPTPTQGRARVRR